MTTRKRQKNGEKVTKPLAASANKLLPRAEVRRQEIILAAAAEFSQKGYAEATLTDIAQRMGIHTAALYYYFENKDAVVEAVLRLAADRISNDLQEQLQANPGSTPIDRLKTAIRAYVTATSRRDHLGRAFWKIYDQVAPELWDSVKDHQHTMFPLWEELVADAAAAGQIRTDLPLGVFRHLLIGALIWLPEWYNPKGTYSFDDVADAIMTIFLGTPASKSIDTEALPLQPKVRSAKVRSTTRKRQRVSS